MEHNQEIRYSRHISLPEIGANGQKRLLESKVLVVGAGGLGSPLLLYLAASGIGKIGVLDSDKVELSNLQRQVLHETSDIGIDKTSSARDAMLDLNPGIEIIEHNCTIADSNAQKIISQYDIVADCSDNIKTRLLLNDLCYQMQKTLVSGAISGFSGQISSFKAYLADEYPCYRCLYPKIEGQADQKCSESGVFSPVAGIVGVWQASEVIKEILSIGESLAGYLIRFDSLTCVSKKVKLKRNKNCECCSQKKFL